MQEFHILEPNEEHKQIKRKNSLDNVMTLLWSERETENRHKEKQQIDTKRNRQLQKLRSFELKIKLT